ncbi:DMT family transporter [Streptomyces violaceusniger]|uniref:DMT family transporter n=1 Tax=Streptomyces violaceusniger TaxID=68280 RepID=UPI0036815B11
MNPWAGGRHGLVPVLAVALVALLAGTWLLSGELVEDTDPLLVAVGRTGVACTVLAAFAAARADTREQARAVLARPGRLVQLALLGFAAYALGTLLAMPRIGTSLTNLVVALMPCASLALGALWFGQRATVRQAAGAVLATSATAAYALLGGGSRLDGAGLLLAVAGMLAFAWYGFLYRQHLGGIAPAAALPVLLGAATALLLPFALAAHEAAPGEWAGIAVLGGAVYVPAYLVQHRLILLRGPVFTAAVQLAVPFTVRLGEWATGLSGPPSAAEVILLGGALVGIALVTLPRLKRSTSYCTTAHPTRQGATPPDRVPRTAAGEDRP